MVQWNTRFIGMLYGKNIFYCGTVSRETGEKCRDFSDFYHQKWNWLRISYFHTWNCAFSWFHAKNDIFLAPSFSETLAVFWVSRPLIETVLKLLPVSFELIKITDLWGFWKKWPKFLHEKTLFYPKKWWKFKQFQKSPFRPKNVCQFSFFVTIFSILKLQNEFFCKWKNHHQVRVFFSLQVDEKF